MRQKKPQKRISTAIPNVKNSFQKTFVKYRKGVVLKLHLFCLDFILVTSVRLFFLDSIFTKLLDTILNRKANAFLFKITRSDEQSRNLFKTQTFQIVFTPLPTLRDECFFWIVSEQKKYREPYFDNRTQLLSNDSNNQKNEIVLVFILKL